MKKTAAFVMGTIMLLALCFSSFAGTTENHVYAESVIVEAGEEFNVPIYVENNKGFMGFALLISYNGQTVVPISVAKGTMLSGMFNDSIAAAEGDSFKIVFSATEDCVTDGILCTVKFRAQQSVSGREKIQITYSSDDTFNEQWKPVALNCEDVRIVITQNGTTAPIETETETEPEETATEATEPQTEPESTTKVEPKPVDEKDSVRLRTWFKSLPTVFRVLLAGLIYPAIWILSLFGR